MEYQVNLSNYGIVEGSLGASPYSAADYLQAENNRIGIQNAIDFASSNGYTKVSFPKFHITLGYKYSSNSAFAASGDVLIYLKPDMEYDFGNGLIEIMFDSVNKSPYHTSTYRPNPYQLNGKVISTAGANNVIVKNLILKGDIYYRAFTNTSEKGEEQTYGIIIESDNVVIENCNIHGFMGDAITGSNAGLNSLADLGTYNEGYFNGSSVVAKLGCYVSDMIDIDMDKYQAANSPKLLQLRRSGGYDRTPMIANPTHEIIWFNSIGTMLERKFYQPFDLLYIPKDASKVRMQIFNETPGLGTITHGIYPLVLSTPFFRNITIINNKIHDNHRGGISNLGDDIIISKNEFFNNGMDSGIGAPLFPDTTRYQINIEDNYSSRVSILDNKLVSSFNGILLGAEIIEVRRNHLSNSGGVTIYRSASAIIKDNNIHQGSIAFSAGRTDRGSIRKIIISNNVIYNTISDAVRVDSEATKNTKIIIEDNVFTISRIVILSDVVFNGNQLFFVRLSDELLFSPFQNISQFNDNIIEGKFGDTLAWLFRLNLQNVIGKNNIVKNVHVSYTGYTYGNPSSWITKGFHFINCSLNGNNLQVNDHDIWTKYEDCIFENTTIKPSCSSAPLFTTKLYLTNVKIINNSLNSLIHYTDLNNYSAGRNHELFLDNVDIENNSTTIPKLISFTYSFMTYRVKIKANRVKAIGMGDLMNNISVKGVTS